MKILQFVEHVRGSPKEYLVCHDSYFRNCLGLFLFDGLTITGDEYCGMLAAYGVPILTDGNDHLIFQQDGAGPHYATVVRDYLDETLPQRWCGRGGGIGWRSWPARSPDLTPLDFFLLGFVKDKVYSVKIRDIDHLKERITEAVRSVTPTMMNNVWDEILERLNLCKDIGGAHLEVY